MEPQIEAYLIEQVLQGKEHYNPYEKREMLSTRHIALELNLDPNDVTDVLHRLESKKRVEKQWMCMEYQWRASWRILPLDPNWKYQGGPTPSEFTYQCPKCGDTTKSISKDFSVYCAACPQELRGKGPHGATTWTRMERTNK